MTAAERQRRRRERRKQGQSWLPIADHEQRQEDPPEAPVCSGRALPVAAIAAGQAVTDATQSTELIHCKNRGPAETSLVFLHKGPVSEDMVAIFGEARLSTLSDVPPVVGAVRRISLNSDSLIDWVNRMWARVPKSFKLSPVLRRPTAATPSFADLIAQRHAPGSTQPATEDGSRTRERPALIAWVAAMFGLVVLVGMYLTLNREGAAVERSVVVTASRLNCRAGPSPTSEVLHVAKNGENLALLNQGATWWQVRMQETACRVSSDYVKLAVLDSDIPRMS